MDRADKVKLSIEYLLECFEAPYFPRTIQAKTGAQITVNSVADILYHFQKVDFIDCRISLFGQEEINQIKPNAIFIDLDNISKLEFVKLRFFNVLQGRPMIIFTGRGYAIVQPIDIMPMNGLKYNGYDGEFISKEFLKFAKDFLTHDNADTANHPSLKNTLVRVPHTINSKSGNEVKLIESWNNIRVPINNLPFKDYFQSVIDTQKQTNDSFIVNPKSYSWIENLLSNQPIYKSNRLLGLVVARYLMNVKKLSITDAASIIKKWDSNYGTSEIHSELNYALKIGKAPVGLKQFREKNQDYAAIFDKIPHLTKHNKAVDNLQSLFITQNGKQSKFVDTNKTTGKKPDTGSLCYVCNEPDTVSKGKLFDGRDADYCASCWDIVKDCKVNQELVA